VALFGALRPGLVVINLNPQYTSREMIDILTEVEAKAIVVMSNFAYIVEQILPETALEKVIVTNISDLFPTGKRMFYILDRREDRIVVGKHVIYPNEIEAIIVMIESIKEVAVLGITDTDPHHQDIKAFVVTKDPNLTAKAVISHCQKHLPVYKIPKVIEFRNWLPKTNVGTILRRALRHE